MVYYKMCIIVLTEQGIKTWRRIKRYHRPKPEDWLRLVLDTGNDEKWSDLQYTLKRSLTGLAGVSYYRGVEEDS